MGTDDPRLFAIGGPVSAFQLAYERAEAAQAEMRRAADAGEPANGAMNAFVTAERELDVLWDFCSRAVRPEVVLGGRASIGCHRGETYTMPPLTGNRTINGHTNAVVVHTPAARQTGYAKDQIVVHGGVAWRSLVDANKTVPGETALWDLWE